MNGTTTTYAYDNAGVRVRKATGSTSTIYLNDPQNPTGYTKAIEERDGSTNAVTRSYVLGMDVEAQRDATNGTQYLITDGHGSTRELVDLTGGITQSFNYDAFGTLLNMGAATAKTPWLFGGDGLYDPASGLTYHLARWRDGFRFTSYDSFEADPGSPASLHKYIYAEAAPTRYSDDTGHYISEFLVVASFSLLLLSLVATKILTNISGSYIVSDDQSRPDIAAQLLSLRKDFLNQYASLSSAQRKYLDSQIISTKAETNWEIPSLAALGLSHRTVTVNGQVFVADEVNYWLYGVWLKAAGKSEFEGESLIYLHRKFYTTNDPRGSGIDGRQAWFRAGFENDLFEARSAARSFEKPSLERWENKLDFYVGSPPIISHTDETSYAN